MKKSILAAIVLLALGPISANATHLHLSLAPPPFNESDPLATTGTATGFVPFFLYVIADEWADPGAGLFGYEFSLNLDPNWIILGTVLTGPAPINIGTPTNVIAGTGGAVATPGPVVIVRYQLGWFAGPVVPETLISLGPSTPSSFSPATPGYLQPNGELVAWECTTNLLINPSNGATAPPQCSTDQVPAPATFALLGLGLLGVAIRRRFST